MYQDAKTELVHGLTLPPVYGVKSPFSSIKLFILIQAVMQKSLSGKLAPPLYFGVILILSPALSSFSQVTAPFMKCNYHACGQRQ